jgi:hypothetical protein
VPPATAATPSPTAALANAAARARVDRPLSDGVTIDRPMEIVPTFLTNVAERITGEHDPRVGKALTNVLLAGERLITAGLRSAGNGTGAVAAGSSLLSKALPLFSIATGAVQIWKGWNELQSHDDGVVSIIHSKTGRTGLLQVLAGVLLFVPGVGPVLGGALTRLATAANEMDMFSDLDWPSVPVEQTNEKLAQRLHPFDETPTIAHDRTTTIKPEQGDLLSRAVEWAEGAIGLT